MGSLVMSLRVLGGDGELFFCRGGGCRVWVEGSVGEGRGCRGMCGGQQSWGKGCVGVVGVCWGASQE